VVRGQTGRAGCHHVELEVVADHQRAGRVDAERLAGQVVRLDRGLAEAETLRGGDHVDQIGRPMFSSLEFCCKVLPLVSTPIRQPLPRATSRAGGRPEGCPVPAVPGEEDVEGVVQFVVGGRTGRSISGRNSRNRAAAGLDG